MLNSGKTNIGIRKMVKDVKKSKLFVFCLEKHDFKSTITIVNGETMLNCNEIVTEIDFTRCFQLQFGVVLRIHDKFLWEY